MIIKKIHIKISASSESDECEDIRTIKSAAEAKRLVPGYLSADAIEGANALGLPILYIEYRLGVYFDHKISEFVETTIDRLPTHNDWVFFISKTDLGNIPILPGYVLWLNSGPLPRILKTKYRVIKTYNTLRFSFWRELDDRCYLFQLMTYVPKQKTLDDIVSEASRMAKRKISIEPLRKFPRTNDPVRSFTLNMQGIKSRVFEYAYTSQIEELSNLVCNQPAKVLIIYGFEEDIVTNFLYGHIDRVLFGGSIYENLNRKVLIPNNRHEMTTNRYGRISHENIPMQVHFQQLLMRIELNKTKGCVIVCGKYQFQKLRDLCNSCYFLFATISE